MYSMGIEASVFTIFFLLICFVNVFQKYLWFEVTIIYSDIQKYIEDMHAKPIYCKSLNRSLVLQLHDYC